MEPSPFRYLKSVPTTPEFILSVQRELQRYQYEYGEDDDIADVELTLASTVEFWGCECELVGWKELGRCLNSEWQIEASDAEWKSVLLPEKERTLGDVCRFIVERGGRQYIMQPSHLLGSDCQKGGVFLAIKELLKRAGADITQLRPSSDITPYMKKYANVFGRLMRLAPGKLPLLKDPYISCSLFTVSMRVIFPFFPWILSKFTELSLSYSIYFLYVAALFIIAGLIDKRNLLIDRTKLPPEKFTYHFEGIKTFRDLVECVTIPEMKKGKLV